MSRRSHTESWWANASPTTLRCTAHYKGGERCRTEASPGTNVCDKHGALIPAVRAHAATRIQMSVDEAAAQLIAWLNDPAVDMRERVKIAHDLLDRGGLGVTSKLLVGVVAEDPVERLFRDLLAHEDALEPARVDLKDWDVLGELPSLTAAEDDEDVVDAELVEDPEHEPEAEPVESGSATPPKHMRVDLRRLEKWRHLL